MCYNFVLGAPIGTPAIQGMLVEIVPPKITALCERLHRIGSESERVPVYREVLELVAKFKDYGHYPILLAYVIGYRRETTEAANHPEIDPQILALVSENPRAYIPSDFQIRLPPGSALVSQFENLQRAA